MNITRLLCPSLVALSLLGCGGGDGGDTGEPAGLQARNAGPVTLQQTDFDISTETPTDYVTLAELTFTPAKTRYTVSATYRATAGPGDSGTYQSVRLVCTQGPNASFSYEPPLTNGANSSYQIANDFVLVAGTSTRCGLLGRNSVAAVATLSDIVVTVK